MFYAAKNHYASETDAGFSSTWYVVAFPTREARNAHINSSSDRATKAITSAECRKYGAVPGAANFADIWGDGLLIFVPNEIR